MSIDRSFCCWPSGPFAFPNLFALRAPFSVPPWQRDVDGLGAVVQPQACQSSSLPNRSQTQYQEWNQRKRTLAAHGEAPRPWWDCMCTWIYILQIHMHIEISVNIYIYIILIYLYSKWKQMVSNGLMLCTLTRNGDESRGSTRMNTALSGLS